MTSRKSTRSSAKLSVKRLRPIGEIFNLIDYKWYGPTIIKAPRYYPSTGRCSHCHHIGQALSVEIWRWHCEKCGAEHDRDINTAKNLLNLYTESSSGIYACGDTSNGESEQLSSYVSLKQEVNNGIFVHKS